jgi:flagellar protein FlaI
LEQAATQVRKQEARRKEGGKKREERKKALEAAELSEGVEFLPVKEGWKIVEEYWVVEPYAKVKIVEIPELGGQKAYYVEEVQLTREERRAVDKLIDILSVELEPPASFEADVRQHIIEQARRLAEKYRSAVRVPRASWGKVLYYIERDLVGYGPIEVLMRDYKLEDVSCDGVDRPIHVWHRDYESIPTNVVFRSRDALREFVVKLAHMAGKHISAAFPLVDAMLPGRHRLAATYGEEVSPKGSTFTIRKFRERPFSIVELLESGNIDSWTAAYLWLMIENKMTVMVIGATARAKPPSSTRSPTSSSPASRSSPSRRHPSSTYPTRTGSSSPAGKATGSAHRRSARYPSTTWSGSRSGTGPTTSSSARSGAPKPSSSSRRWPPATEACPPCTPNPCGLRSGGSPAPQ